MLVFHGGITYLLIGGKLWIDYASYIPYEQWLKAGKQWRNIIWKHGNCPIQLNPFSKAGIRK
jgi:hypothetical protein